MGEVMLDGQDNKLKVYRAERVVNGARLSAVVKAFTKEEAQEMLISLGLHDYTLVDKSTK